MAAFIAFLESYPSRSQILDGTNCDQKLAASFQFAFVEPYVYSHKEHTPHEKQVILVKSAGLKEVQNLIGFNNGHDCVYMAEVCLKKTLASLTAREIEDPFTLEVVAVLLTQRFGGARWN